MGRPTDQELDESIAGMLLVGVGVAAAIMLVGGVMLLRHPGVADYSRFVAGGPGLRTVGGIFAGVGRRNAASIVQLGLLVLIATPVVRVGFCVVGFARQRSGLYVGVSLVVLGILAYSLIVVR